MYVSLAAAITLTNISERTLWRIVSKEHWPQQKNQGRVMIPLSRLRPYCCIDINEEELRILAKADTRIGTPQDAAAQCELALIFLHQGQWDSGIYWLKRAVAADHADALNLLGMFYLNGEGIEKNPSEGLRFIRRSAELGHQLSKQQLMVLNAIASPLDTYDSSV